MISRYLRLQKMPSIYSHYRRNFRCYWQLFEYTWSWLFELGMAKTTIQAEKIDHNRKTIPKPKESDEFHREGLTALKGSSTWSISLENTALRFHGMQILVFFHPLVPNWCRNLFNCTWHFSFHPTKQFNIFITLPRIPQIPS